MSKILPIRVVPHPDLRKKSLAVDPAELKDQKFKKLYQDMAKTMLEKDGVGLAAPQIGKNIRLIAVNTKSGPVIMANPCLKNKSWFKEWGEEGCLSVPQTFGEVKRYKKINCVYLGRDGQKKIVAAAGLLARVIQHEIDHLDGVLFIDKAKNIKKDGI